MLQFYTATPRSPWLVVAAVATTFGFVAEVRATDTCAPAVARVVSVQGGVELRRSQQTNWQSAQQDGVLCAGDRVRVGERGRAALLLDNETTLRLDQNTSVGLAAPDDGKTSLLDLLRGAIHVITRTPKPFKVTTPFANAGVEGTEFVVGVDAAGARLAALEGQVSVSNEFGSLHLFAGEVALVASNVAPRNERNMRPADAVQWALYYPNVIDYAQGGKGGGAAEPALRESIELYRQGQLAEAIFHSDKRAKGSGDPRTLTYRAGLLLLVGRVDEAKPDIERALQLDPRYADAYALQAVVAAVQNHTEQALQLATRAVELDGASSTAHMALSYAEQAHARIEDALASAQKAADLAPNNALAWARLAELHMASGDLDRALAAAQRAAVLDPKLARTQAVLGFAQLTRMNTRAAKQAFRKAIELDQSDPLPRLGLGLAEIRDGDLATGREEIEIAVCLDPNNSLIRSYMGKTYYEERRNALAGKQFDLAKSLDARDPTPWFYDAIRVQSENRPVEALADLQKSIELNDNRAVYRSRLLLDEDLAVRGTSLARIYDNLGFTQPARAEASKSLSIDPASYSAHRFLSDAYARQPRHEIARVSELLRSQLLQPANVNPVQPQLAVTDLNIASGVGPAEAAFNEFTPLFGRDRPQLVAAGLVGNQRTLSDEVVVSGLAGRLSYSLGQFHYETDGFRANNDLTHDIHDMFVQFTATPTLNLQAEVTQRDTKAGDLTLDFDEMAFSLRNRQEISQSTLRLGANWSIAPATTALFSAIQSRRTEQQARFFPLIDVATDVEDEGHQLEAQVLHRERNYHLTAGAGSYSIDTRLTLATDLTPFLADLCEFTPCLSTTESTFKKKRDNFYVYSGLRFPEPVVWILGLGFDSFKEGNFSVERVNPKFGIQWEFARGWLLRAAAFDTIKPALVVNQTIEPTEVAGFNQFFDDSNGTKATRIGIGLDGGPGKNVRIGVEASRRRLEIPILNADTLSLSSLEQAREDDARAYLNWVVHPNWSFTIAADYERSVRSPDAVQIDRPTAIRTNSFPLSLRYFNPTGLFGEFRATGVRQDVERQPESFLRSGSDRFVLFDLALGYRMPRRMGIVSFEVRNLFDEKFNFSDLNLQNISEPVTPRFVPARTALLRFTVSF